jgi:hypothetical protein
MLTRWGVVLIVTAGCALWACGSNEASVNPGDTQVQDTLEVTPEVTQEVLPEEVAPVCTANAKKCLEGAAAPKGISTCKADGSAWVDDECQYRCVVEDNTARCKDKVCEANSRKCAGTKNLLICNELGTGYNTFACPELCVAKENDCGPAPKCTVGTKECDEGGSFLKTCIKEGDNTTWTWDKCDYGCDATKKACLDATCQAGAVRCNPDDKETIEECNKDSTGWKFVQKCNEGCENAKCKDYPCAVGEKRCNYYAVEVCKLDKSGFEFDEGCSVACVQEGTNAYCAGCAPGAPYCEGSKVMSCEDPSAPKVVETCGSGTGCAVGQCLPEVVMSDMDEDTLWYSYLDLAQAVVDCWRINEGSGTNVLCATVDAELMSVDVTATDFIDNWYCYYWFFEEDFKNAGDLDVAENTIFTCAAPADRHVDFKLPITAGSLNKTCVWYDTWATDEVFITDCDLFVP